MKKTFFSVFPLFSVVPLNRLKFNEVSSLQEFILLPSPFGEGLGVRLFLLPSGRSGGGFFSTAKLRITSFTCKLLVYSAGFCDESLGRWDEWYENVTNGLVK